MGSIMSCLSNFMYTSEKISLWASSVALISCLILMFLVTLGMGIGLGYNYCFVDMKTRYKYVPGHYIYPGSPRWPHRYGKGYYYSTERRPPYYHYQTGRPPYYYQTGSHYYQTGPHYSPGMPPHYYQTGPDYSPGMPPHYYQTGPDYSPGMPPHYPPYHPGDDYYVGRTMEPEDELRLPQPTPAQFTFPSENSFGDGHVVTLPYAPSFIDDTQLDESNDTITNETTHAMELAENLTMVSFTEFNATMDEITPVDVVESSISDASDTGINYDINDVSVTEAKPHPKIHDDPNNKKVKKLIIPLSGGDLVSLLTQLRPENKNYSLQIVTT